MKIIKKLISSELRINMISGMVATLINIVTLVIAYPIYLHFLGYEQYGVWLILSAILGFAQIGNLGIGQAVMKLVAEEHGHGDLKSAQQYMTSAIVILLISGFVVLAIIIFFKALIIELFNLSEENAKMAIWLLPYIACLSVYVFIVQAVNAILAGLGRMDLANYSQMCGRFVTVIIATILLSLDMGIKALLISSITSNVLIHAMSFAIIRRIAPVRIGRLHNISLLRMRRLLFFGSRVLGGTLLSLLLNPFNKLMISRYASVASIPIYEIAYSASMQIRGLVEAGIRALIPEVSRIGVDLTEQAKARIREIHRRCFSLIMCFALPAYTVLFLTVPFLLQIWLGNRLTESLPMILRIALVSSLLSLTCVPAYYILMGIGKVRHCFINHAILGGTNVLLVLTFAWIDNGLTLAEVFISNTVGTLFSTIYVIRQKRKAIDQTVSSVNTSPVPTNEVSVYHREASVTSSCL